jgi:hypothetical protein
LGLPSKASIACATWPRVATIEAIGACEHEEFLQILIRHVIGVIWIFFLVAVSLSYC